MMMAKQELTCHVKQYITKFYKAEKISFICELWQFFFLW